MPVFFVKTDKDLVDGEQISIVGDDAYHIARSLRMATGDEIRVSNGREQATCSLVSIRDSECVARVNASIGAKGEPPYRVIVYQGLPKGDKLELVIQKSTECGAVEIVPFVGDFCTVRMTDEGSEQKKTVRRQRIACEAAKQCGRTVIPTVQGTCTFSSMLDKAFSADAVIFCYEHEHTLSLREALERIEPAGKTVALVIGSEGGFSEKEAECICERGAVCVSLGERILRSESAAIFVLSAMSTLFE